MNTFLVFFMLKRKGEMTCWVATDTVHEPMKDASQSRVKPIITRQGGMQGEACHYPYYPAGAKARTLTLDAQCTAPHLHSQATTASPFKRKGGSMHKSQGWANPALAKVQF